MNMHHFFRRGEKILADNSPAILAGFGVLGVVGTAYLAGTASFKAAEILRDYEDDREPTDFRTQIELVWKEYVPAIAFGSLAIFAIIGSNRIGTRRTMVYAAAYNISERAYSEYKQKVVDTIGKNKEQKIHDEVMQDRINRHPSGGQEILDTGGGKDLCYDTWNGRYFWSSQEAIKQAQNAVNYRINHSWYASLSDFYDRLGLDRTRTSDDFGWNSTDQLEIQFTTTISDKGQPCLVMDFLVAPIRGYEKVGG